MPEAPALLAGRYRLGILLGRGGMGAVRLARDEVLERDVAVKELDQPSAEEGDAAARRTLREARAAARLSHPGVVQVYDVLQLDGRTWIVMEYVPSRSLRQVIQEDGPLDPYRAARIGLDLLAALRAAHRVGVQHRDVKPANVLLADDGRVLLSDFGIAAVDDDAVISRADVVVGSPQFMAPERARTGSGGPEADLWSLGATLYAAVEGRPPFLRASTMATLAALATEEPDPPRQAGALRPLLDGLLRKDPAVRMGAEDAESLLRSIIADLSDDGPRIPRQRTAVMPAVTEAADDTPEAGSRSGTASEAHADESGAGGDTAPHAGERVGTAPSADVSEAERGRDAVGTASPGAEEARRAGAEEARRAGAEEARRAGAAADGDREDGSGAGGAGPKADVWVGRATARGPADGAEHDDSRREAGTRLHPVPGRRRRATLAVVGSLTAVVAAVAVWLVAGRGQDDPAAERARPTGSAGPQATGSPGPQATGLPGPQNVAPPKKTQAATTTPASPDGEAAGARPELPDGWRDYRDATGFEVYVPAGWKRSKEGSIVYFRGDGRVLGIDQTDRPKSDPVADWRGQSRYRVSRGDFPNYREIKIESVRYFRKAADWEFTFDRGGVRQHVNNRGVVVADDKAYGFYWQTRDSEWDEAREDLQLVFDSFQPAE